MLRSVLSVVLIPFVCVVANAKDFMYLLEFPETANIEKIDGIGDIQKRNDAKASFELGVCQLFGLGGIDKDEQSAVMNFAKATFEGLNEAKYAFALCQLYGWGIEKNV
ncbi:MAG: sel1 repeat family protein, partial [Opitutales bacterium]|nr:sel1 repeat family protein [Opitutales bacterium]